jgi:hypothetical protein
MFDVLKAQKRRPAIKKISTMQAFRNEIFWGCDLAGETPGRVNHTSSVNIQCQLKAAMGNLESVASIRLGTGKERMHLCRCQVARAQVEVARGTRENFGLEQTSLLDGA